MKQAVPISILGERILRFRKTWRLTQAELAVRYGVSGPAVFKFEKGFVTPSLKTWLRIAEDMDIPEKEAVLLWIREKTPEPLRRFVEPDGLPDFEQFEADLAAAARDAADPAAALRETVLGCPSIAPSLKAFLKDKTIAGTLRLDASELSVLARLSRSLPRMSVNQYRDLVLVARAIRNPED